MLRRRRRDQHAQQGQRPEQTQALPRHARERSESPLGPLLQAFGLAGADEHGDNGRHPVPEHQPENQHGGRIGDAAGDDQHEPQDKAGACNRRQGHECVAADARRRAKRHRRAIARAEHDQRDAETRAG